MTVIAYIPALRGGFIWDDDHFLTQNRLIGASDGLQRFWLSREAPDYWPLSSSSLWIEWRLWGMNPAGYHATNVALHVACALLLWGILRRLLVPGAFLAALIFAVHPVNVESVAWITQRKNLLAMVFYLLSIRCFLMVGIVSTQAADTGAKPSGSVRVLAEDAFKPMRSVWYWLSVGAFVLAMLSKASVVILPLVLIGLIGWHRRISARDVSPLLPFGLLAFALAFVNLWFQHREPTQSVRAAGLLQRLFEASGAVWFYLSKAVLPANLNFVYPAWHLRPDGALGWVPLAGVVVVTLTLWRNSRMLLFAWGYFCVALLPALGFADAYFMKYSLVADHYQHLAIIGVIVPAVVGWALWSGKLGGRRVAAALLASTAVCGLATMTWSRNRIFADAPALYQSVIGTNPGCWMAWNELGLIARNEGRFGDAMLRFKTALRFNPDFAEAHNNLAIELARGGRLNEAIGHYEEAVRIDSRFAEAQNNLGNALFESGRRPEGIAHYEEALRLRPEFPDAENNLANALRRFGRSAEAVAHYRQALRLKPDFPEACNGLGNALRELGRTAEAIASYERALQLKPDYADAHNNLGATLAIVGRATEAIEQYAAALKLRPDYPEAHYNNALALRALGRTREAAAEFQEAERLGAGTGMQRR